jgi:hypothetical protein
MTVTATVTFAPWYPRHFGHSVGVSLPSAAGPLPVDPASQAMT